MRIGSYLKEKAPELLVIVFIIGGFSWLFPKVQTLEVEQSTMKEKVNNTEERLERIAKASEVYGIKVAESEITKPIEMASLIISLKKHINKDEYAAIVLSLKDNNHLVFRTNNYQKASIAYAISRNIVEGHDIPQCRVTTIPHLH